MAAERRVIFLAGDPYYVQGFKRSKTHLRGRVVNGEWNVIIDKRHGGGLWHVHRCDNLSAVKESNLLFFVHEHEVYVIDVPEQVRGDFHVIENWAKTQLAKEEQEDAADDRN